MKRFKVTIGKSKSGKQGYCLQAFCTPTNQNAANQPVTRQDILNLQKTLEWPPKFTRDINLMEMKKHHDALHSVWNDDSLNPTDKLLKAGFHSRLFAIFNKKFFSKGRNGGDLLLSSASQNMNETNDLEDFYSFDQEATISDKKQTHSLIPVYKGTPLSIEKSLINVPQHLQSAGEKMLLALKNPKSPISWDSQGKIIDKSAGSTSKGRVLQGTNIQDIIGFATQPSPHYKPPKGYDLIRSALIDSGLGDTLSPIGEQMFKDYSRRKKSPKTPGTIKRGVTPRHRFSSTPLTSRTVAVKGSKLFGK